MKGQTMQWMNALIPFALFVALILAASLQVLAAAGHFPLRSKGDAAATPFKRFVLFGSTVVVILCLVAGIAAAFRFIPWYAAVIGGGFSLLAAPLVLRGFSDRFVDGPGAPLAFAGTSAVFALLLVSLVVASRCVAGPEARNWRADDKTIVLLDHGKCVR
jgi:hypothetical protein